MMNRLLLIVLVSAILSTQAIPFKQRFFDQDAEIETNTFHLVNADRVFPAEPAAMVLRRFESLRALPLMKKSIAIGRAGFRPGKRASAIYAF